MVKDLRYYVTDQMKDCCLFKDTLTYLGYNNTCRHCRFIFYSDKFKCNVPMLPSQLDKVIRNMIFNVKDNKLIITGIFYFGHYDDITYASAYVPGETSFIRHDKKEPIE